MIRAIRKTLVLGATGIGVAMPLAAQATDTSTHLKVNGFVDTYYAYDFGRPPDGERRYTTQPVRHDEFNVNLAWIGLTVERPRMHARVALQAGTSVQANYASEPRTGATSGPDLARNIQEAYAGVKLTDNLWLDAGIYYSYIGLESWSSTDNPTYTRSLVADYTPYYLSGARLTWSPTPKLTAQFHLMNGWQNISENNRSKAVGSRIDYAVTPALTLSYANFIGNEQPTGTPAQTRVFNQVMAKGTLASATQWQGQVDVGRQGGHDWYGLVAIARQPISPRVAIVGRIERYADPDGVIIAVPSSGNPLAFVGNGASIGVDVQLDGGVRWRSEFRNIHTTDLIYPDGPSRPFINADQVLVTSLSLAF